VRVALIVNRDAGGGTADARRDELLQALRAAGAEATAVEVAPAEFTRAAREAAGEYDAVVAAGGDGTVSSVAAGLVGTGTPLGVLPEGTLNHFAKDLGIPLEAEEAAAVIAAGHVRDVDVGEVNGRTFVNNSSVGLYPLAVAERERLQDEHGHGKWVAMARASLHVLRRLPVMTVELRVDGELEHVRTPLVFVGNNEYETQGIPPGGRTTLNDGVLCLYTARVERRAHAVWLALRAVFGRLEGAEGFDARTCSSELEVSVRRPHALRVALDGEVERMRPPLRYRVRAGELRVLAPAPDAGG
jgi:diacylglycerol kinase family enzyme